MDAVIDREAGRLEAVARYTAFGLDSEPAFDELAQLAAALCGVPIGLITFVQAEQQPFKAAIGTDVRETARDISFCTHIIDADADMMVVPDMLADARFRDNPLVTGPTAIRFYAGAVLRTTEGHAIGTLCVLDTAARTLTEQQQASLQILARQVMMQLDLRLAVASRARVEVRHKAIIDSATDYAIIATDLDARIIEWSAGAQEVFGWTEAEILGRPAHCIFVEEDREAGVPEQEMALALAMGRAPDNRWHLRRDGDRVFTSGELMPLFDADGTQTGFVKVLRDRTQQHEAAEALRETEGQLRRAQEAGGIGVFTVDRHGVLRASPQFARIYGMDGRTIGPASMFEALVIEEDGGIASTQRTRESGEAPLDVRYRIRRPDTGEVRWISRRAEIERDATGAFVRFIGVAQDVTDVVAAQSDLLAERELLAQMFEQAPTFMALLAGPHHRVERVNPGFVRLIAGRDIVGQPVAEALPDAVEQGLVEVLDQVFESGMPFAADGVLYTAQTDPDAAVHHRYVDVVFQPIRDRSGAVGGIFIEGADVTDRMKTAAALRSTEERYRTVLDSIEVGFCVIEVIFDAEGTPVDYLFIETNAAFEQQSGLSDPIGRTMRQMQPDYEQYWFDLYGRVARTGLRQRAQSGSQALGRWWDVYAIRLGNPAEHRVAVLFTDDTDRRIMEEELRDLNTTLEEQVHARTRDLMTAEEQLRQAQKMEAVGQLTGGIAHDFNNMLTGVIGSLDLIGRHLAAGRMDRVQRYMEAANSSAQRAAALTARLLAFGRRQSLDLTPVDVAQLVLNLEELLRRTLGEQVRLAIDLDDARWSALTDANQLEAALLNLCINARDAMPDGGNLSITTGSTRFSADDVRGQDGLAAGEYVLLSVADTGMGMSQTTVTRAFEPFFTTKPIGQGTGLGLSMIYGFAKQSGGHVRIDSAEGKGTTVSLFLPRAEKEAVDAVEAVTAAPRGDGERVLVVEDDPAVRLIVLDVLEELGYQAVAAVDADGAIPILRGDGRIDLLISDVGLPGMNGRQLADIARQARPDLRILFITGYAERAAVRSGFLEAGMEMMSKPFDVEELAHRVRRMLANS